MGALPTGGPEPTTALPQRSDTVQAQRVLSAPCSARSAQYSSSLPKTLSHRARSTGTAMEAASSG